jgi:hypothetical protein
MKTSKYLPVLLAVIMLAPGCSTDSATQNLGGVMTASTLVVALPLIPFTLPYSAIEQSKVRKKDKALYQKLDPVYQKRIEMIKARSPNADADEAWNQGALVFIPSIFNGGNYPGLEKTEYNLKNGKENQRQIIANNFLTYLQTLLSDDPLQQQVQILNKKYLEFLHVCWVYEEAFNLEMYQRIQNAKSSEAK